MSQILLSALLVALVIPQVARAEHRLPVFDVKQECRAPASVTPGQRCLGDEQSARAELTTKWSSFADGDRGHCIGEATAGGSPSYVDLLTCLEIARDARLLEKK